MTEFMKYLNKLLKKNKRFKERDNLIITENQNAKMKKKNIKCLWIRKIKLKR